MKIAQLTPGSGDNFYCENCLRDLELVKAVGALGHEMVMVPLYLPRLRRRRTARQRRPRFLRGINVYLQQKMDFFHRTPRWLDRLLDSPRLLNWACRLASMTDARTLGQTTVSMLRGENGRQAKELNRLAAWLSEPENRPDVIVLSNALLAGAAAVLKARVGAKLVCLLQDEDGFLNALGEPYAGQAWQLIAERAGDIDAFVSVSAYYAELMKKALKIDAGKMHVVHAGISLEGCDDLRRPGSPTTDTSLACAPARTRHAGEAFIAQAGFGRGKVEVAGGQTAADANSFEPSRNGSAPAA